MFIIFYLINTGSKPEILKKIAHWSSLFRCPPAQTARGPYRLRLGGGHPPYSPVGVRACLVSRLGRLGPAALGCEFCRPGSRGTAIVTHRVFLSGVAVYHSCHGSRGLNPLRSSHVYPLWLKSWAGFI